MGTLASGEDEPALLTKTLIEFHFGSDANDPVRYEPATVEKSLGFASRGGKTDELHESGLIAGFEWTCEACWDHLAEPVDRRFIDVPDLAKEGGISVKEHP